MAIILFNCGTIFEHIVNNQSTEGLMQNLVKIGQAGSKTKDYTMV